MTKAQAQEIIDSLPAEFEPEELVERLLFISEVSAGLKQADEGDTLSQEEVEKLAKTWS